MRGGFSNELTKLRSQLLDFTSLIELELDFSEEDVEFADRTNLKQLATGIEQLIRKLADSFSVGNAIKTVFRLPLSERQMPVNQPCSIYSSVRNVPSFPTSTEQPAM